MDDPDQVNESLDRDRSLPDLSTLPPIYLFSTHLDLDELDDVEDKLSQGHARLTYDAKEARLFIGNITRKRRAVLELKSLGVWTEERPLNDVTNACDDSKLASATGKRKRSLNSHGPDQIELSSSSIAAGTTSSSNAVGESSLAADFKASWRNHIECKAHQKDSTEDNNSMKVVSLSWLEASISAGKIVPYQDHLIYHGMICSSPALSLPSPFSSAQANGSITKPKVNEARLPDHGRIAVSEQVHKQRSHETWPHHQYENQSSSKATAARDSPSQTSTAQHRQQRQYHPPPSLSRATTSEHDAHITCSIPPPPTWVSKHLIYSCQRSTPLSSPNRAFAAQLKTIRLSRILTDDQIGVRAYSTAIASVLAYPYTLSSPNEIKSLPGCSGRIAELFIKWKNTGERTLEDAKDVEDDPRMKVLRLFHEIWGVGPSTARRYYDQGWRDLDDVVEYGWTTMSREQQLGVKFYDEFQLKISRTEVESIEAVVKRHMRQICSDDPDGVRMCIVGGYRRGKAESGDADIIVSHMNEARTRDIVPILVESLYKEGWVTHSLRSHDMTSRREQAPKPLKHRQPKREGGGGRGHSFDSLDKAMVVWQDPHFSYEESESAEDGKETRRKNPSVHRRVDIIVVPYSRIGCAVLGWSAGTTFERDLRRYAKAIKGWTFDSSGIRDNRTGEFVDLESGGTHGMDASKADDILEREKKVFEGLDLEWRKPSERCTG